MKKLSILLLVSAGILLLPGCKNPFKRSSSEKDSAEMVDSDIEAFEVVGEGDPFGAGADFSIVSDDDDAAVYAQQGQYGLHRIFFDFDSYKIRLDQEPALRADAEKIRKLIKEGKTITIEGYACNSAGSPKYNMTLSERRSRAVKKYLVRQGVPAKGLRTVGRGCEQPLVRGGDRKVQAPNRRTDFIVL